VNQRHYFLTTEEFFNKIGHKRAWPSRKHREASSPVMLASRWFIELISTLIVAFVKNTYVDGLRLARWLSGDLIGSLAIICPACLCGRT
jgi:hypothetical protein